MNYYLGIDAGTYESKGVLMDATGKIVAKASRKHDMLIPQPGFAEHDAETAWWGDLCYISREILSESGVDPKTIKAVGCSAIGPCCLPVDENLNPLSKAILYGIDVRAKKQIEYLRNKLGDDYILEKYGNPITSQSIGPKILWIKENRPEIYAKTARFITASTYMVAKLTGKYVIDRYTAAYFTPMYDLDKNDWDYENLAEFCRPDQLAETKWTNEIAGYVTDEAALATGLLVGTPVIVGTADAAADAVGTGVINPGDLLIMFGSSVYMIHVVPQLVTDKRYWAGPYHFEDTYMVASGMSTTGTLTKWFRDNLTPDLLERQATEGINAYTLLQDVIKDVPAGSNGLIVLPYFSGERTPINDPNAKGVFFGLTLKHTRADMYNAILEGVAFGIAQHLIGYREIGMSTSRIIAVGGGTLSKKWMQIVSNVTEKEIYIGSVFGAPYGNAILAAYATGEFDSLAQVDKILEFQDIVRPDPSTFPVYRKQLQIYTDLYLKTKDLMASLSSDS